MNKTAQPSISAAEKQPTLQRLESIIERGRATFLEVGHALNEIKIRNLYKETHPTWEAYLKERWGFSHQHAHRLLQAREEAITSPTGDEPKTEWEARARRKAKKEKVQAAKDEEDQITAREAEQAPKVTSAAASEIEEKEPAGLFWWIDIERQALTDDQSQKLTAEMEASFERWLDSWGQHSGCALRVVQEYRKLSDHPDLEDRTRTKLQEAFAIRNDRSVDIEDAICAVREAGFDITRRHPKKLADLFSTDSIKGVIAWLRKNSQRKAVW